MKEKRKSPILADTNLIRYFRQLWGVTPTVGQSLEEYMQDIMLTEDAVIPEGMPEAILLKDRVNLRGMLWTLKEKSELVQNTMLFFSEDSGGYLLVADDSLPGKDGLFLLSVCISQSPQEATTDNIQYCCEKWMPMGNPARLMTGWCRLRDGCIFSVAAVQLASLNLHA